MNKSILKFSLARWQHDWLFLDRYRYFLFSIAYHTASRQSRPFVKMEIGKIIPDKVTTHY